MKPLLSPALMLLSIGAVASAQTAPEPRYPNSADKANFGVRVFVVPDRQKFLESWSNPGAGVRVTTISKAKIGSNFAIPIIYWGGSANSDGKCHMSVVLRIVLPSGSTVAVSDAKLLCSDQPPPEKGALALGRTIIDLQASGVPTRLSLVIEATDLVNGERVSVGVPFEFIN